MVIGEYVDGLVGDVQTVNLQGMATLWHGEIPIASYTRRVLCRVLKKS